MRWWPYYRAQIQALASFGTLIGYPAADRHALTGWDLPRRSAGWRLLRQPYSSSIVD
jgi:hypothetical protein